MHNSAEEKKISEQSSRQCSPMKELEERHLNSTRAFIHDMDGMIQSIVANAELLKMECAHKLSREAVSYLQRIEGNSDRLVNLFNSFKETDPLHPTHNPDPLQK